MVKISLSDGAQLTCEVRGPEAAAPLLLLRPLGGSFELWGGFADRLAQTRRVIMFDPRGVDRSTGSSWCLTTRSLAVDAQAVLAHLGVPRADVFGLSLGGMVASWLAIDAPQAVRSLVLASTLPRPSAISAEAILQFGRFARWALHPSASECEIGLVHEILSPEFVNEHPARIAAIDRVLRSHPTSRRCLLQLAWAAARHDTQGRTREITAPTLILYGDRDPIAKRRSRIQLLHEIPDAHLERIDASGHDLTLEQAERSAEHVVRFLAS